MRVVFLASLLSGCAPMLHVDFEGSDADANCDLAAFDDNPSMSIGDDRGLMFIFDWGDRVNADMSMTMWSRRSFSVNVLDKIEVGELTVEDDQIAVFYGFNPDPDVEDAFDWEASEGTLSITAIEDDVAFINMQLVMEPSGDATGVLRVNAVGPVELQE